MASENPGWGYTPIRGVLENLGYEVGRNTIKRVLIENGIDPAHAERFVRSIKSECLAQIIPLGKRHLRQAVREYAEHYHRERNRQP